MVDRIELVIETDDAELESALMSQTDYVSAEVLASAIRFDGVGDAAQSTEIDGRAIAIEIHRRGH